MTRMFVATKVRMMKAVEGREDAGQGALEYIGAILIAAILIGVIAGAVKGWDVGSKVTDAIDSIFTKAKGD
jgi:hypothetical protein